MFIYICLYIYICFVFGKEKWKKKNVSVENIKWWKKNLVVVIYFFLFDFDDVCLILVGNFELSKILSY